MSALDMNTSASMTGGILQDPRVCSLCKNQFSLQSHESHTPIQGLCGVSYCKACIIELKVEQSANLKRERVNLICPGCNGKCFRADSMSPNLELMKALTMIYELQDTDQSKGSLCSAKSVEELREWSKSHLQNNVVQHAKVFIEWNTQKKRSGSIDSLQELCIEADASMADVLHLSEFEFLELANLLMQHEDESKAVELLSQRSAVLAESSSSAHEFKARTDDVLQESERSHLLSEGCGQASAALVSPTVSPVKPVERSNVVGCQDLIESVVGAQSMSDSPALPKLPVLQKNMEGSQFEADSMVSVSTVGAISSVQDKRLNERHSSYDGTSSATIEKAKAKIIAALSELHAMQIVEVEKDYLAISAGYSCTTTKSFSAALKKLKDDGLLVASTGSVRLSPRGVTVAPPVLPPTSNIEVQERLLGLVLKEKSGMPSPQKILTMFNILLDGALHPRDTLAKAAGFTCTTTKSFMKFVKRLRTLGLLLNKGKKGEIQLNDRVFPFGRPGMPVLSSAAYGDLQLPRSKSNEVPINTIKRKKMSGNGKPNKKKKTTSCAASNRNAQPFKRGDQSLEESRRINVCRSLAEWRSLNIHSPSIQDVAMLAGYTNVGSASFKGAMKFLKSEGIIISAKEKDHVELTAKGVTFVPSVDPPRSNSDMHERILQLVCRKVKDLPKPEKTYAIFHRLSDGQEHTLESLGNLAGYSNVQSASFKNLRKRLMQFGFLIKGTNKNSVVLTHKAFPYGWPRNESMMQQPYFSSVLPISHPSPTTLPTIGSDEVSDVFFSTDGSQVISADLTNPEAPISHSPILRESAGTQYFES